MELVQSVVDGVSYALFLNPATLSGAIDVIMVKHPDGTIHSTPFHVRFGKLQLLRSKEKIVSIEVNDQPVSFSMKLGAAGEAYFVHEQRVSTDEEQPPHTTAPPASEAPAEAAAAAAAEAAEAAADAAAAAAEAEEAAAHAEAVLADAGAGEIPSAFEGGDGAAAVARRPLLRSGSKKRGLKRSRSDSSQRQQQTQDAEGDDHQAKWKWTWGWGSLPRISPIAGEGKEEGKDGAEQEAAAAADAATRQQEKQDIKEEFQEDLEDVIETLAGDENTQDALGSLFGLTEVSPGEEAEGGYVDYCYPASGRDTTTEQEEDSDDLEFFDFEDQSAGGVEEEEELLFGMPDDSDEEARPHTLQLAPGRRPADGRRQSISNFRFSSADDVPAADSRPIAVAASLKASASHLLSPDSDGFAARRRSTSALSSSMPSGPTPMAFSGESREGFLRQEVQRSSAWMAALRREDLSVCSLEISACGHLVSGALQSSPETPEVFAMHRISYAQFTEDPAILNKDNLVLRIEGKYFSWTVARPVIMSLLLFNRPMGQDVIEELELLEQDRRLRKSAWTSWLYPNRWRTRQSVPELPDFARQEEGQQAGGQQQAAAPAQEQAPAAATAAPAKRTHVVGVKSLRPSQAQVEAMNLQPGANKILFSVASELRGRQTVIATVYLWDHSSKLVISDIDGTITRSDVFGHVLPMLGKDWSHSGVAKLFSSIRENGYHIVYLTSRAIGQAQTTRNFINSLRQDGDTTLPKGPVFMAPDRLFTAFNREVIRRKPEEFKIACLKDIVRTFPAGTRPFYAGFGNRETDARAYRAVDVPLGKVFCINPQGTITNSNKTYQKTYLTLHDVVHEMFPHTQDYRKGVSEDYNDWNYWRLPLPELDLDL